MLIWVFGSVKKNIVHEMKEDMAAGYLELERGRVRWMLSINAEHLPADVKAKGKRTYRSLTMGGQEIEFSDGFTELHTMSYQQVIDGKGFGLNDAQPSIQLAHDIRNGQPIGKTGDYHPYLNSL
jgi:UDP-N-acetyl-2-amino-2-deoxyglucuronate dehydrogenase